MTLHKYIIIRSDCTELTAPDLCLRDWSDLYLHFFDSAMNQATGGSRLHKPMCLAWGQQGYCIWAVRTWRKACILVYGMRRKVYTLTGHTYPNLPFPFNKHFISSLPFMPLTPWFMVFAHSPDQTYCVFRGVSGMWRVVVLCIRWVLFRFRLGGWYSCTCRSCIIPRE